jgi:SAM-dependent methyltransferase
MSEILKYWDNPETESMYDKHLLRLEIDLIKKRIPEGSKILDVGCGEGEGTIEYSKIKDVTIHAADFSITRLEKARQRLSGAGNVHFMKVDFTDNYELDKDYDVIICQRFLINIMTWKDQKKVLAGIIELLKPGGIIILLEGSINGVDELNKFRQVLNLPPIPVKWHNCFILDGSLKLFMWEQHLTLIETDGLGEYFLLTRGIRPAFEDATDWRTEFNVAASSLWMKETLGIGSRFSRLKLWVFKK